MKRILTLFAAIMLSVFQANAQTGTWSGKLDVQGTKLSLVFHLDGEILPWIPQIRERKGFLFRSKGRVMEDLRSRYHRWEPATRAYIWCSR